jgi:hypothetical protein
MNLHPGHLAVLAKNGGGAMQNIRPGWDAGPASCCQFPMWEGDRPTHVYCGKPIARRSYCEEHAARCYTAASVAEIDRPKRNKQEPQPPAHHTPARRRALIPHTQRILSAEWATSELERRIIEMQARGMKVDAIAREIGMGGRNVRRVLLRVAERKGEKPKRRPGKVANLMRGRIYVRELVDPAVARDATEARIAKMFNMNMSTSDIAAAVGMNKNQVCGRLHRMRERTPARKEAA